MSIKKNEFHHQKITHPSSNISESYDNKLSNKRQIQNYLNGKEISFKKCLNFDLKMNISLSNSFEGYQSKEFLNNKKVDFGQDLPDYFKKHRNYPNKQYLMRDNSCFKRINSSFSNIKPLIRDFQISSSFTPVKTNFYSSDVIAELNNQSKNSQISLHHELKKRSFIDFKNQSAQPYNYASNNSNTQNPMFMSNQRNLNKNMLIKDTLFKSRNSLDNNEEIQVGISNIDQFILETENNKINFQKIISKIQTKKNCKSTISKEETKKQKLIDDSKPEKINLKKFYDNFNINFDILNQQEKDLLLENIFKQKKCFLTSELNCEELAPFFNLQFEFKENQFKEIKICFKIKFLLVFFTRYINKNELNLVFDQFWEDIDFLNIKNLKKNDSE